MKKIILNSLLALTIAGCQAGPDQTNIELLTDMFDQPNIKVQDWDPEMKDRQLMMVPPEGTRPRGYKGYPFGPGDFAEAQSKLKNSFAGQMTPEILSRGREVYETYCMVCHGKSGVGDGPVAEKMSVKPPALNTAKVKAFNDARIFHIATAGQGVMSGYIYQIRNDEDRWKLVNYVRSLGQQ